MTRYLPIVALLAVLTGCGSTVSDQAPLSFGAAPFRKPDDDDRRQVQPANQSSRGSEVKASTDTMLPARGAPEGRLVFNRLDSNHDARLSQREYLAGTWPGNPYPKQTFIGADGNKDGALSYSEFDMELHSQTAAAWAAIEANDEDMDYELGHMELWRSPLFGEPAGGWPYGEKDVVVQNFIMKYSSDGNGRISIEELMVALQRGIPQARA